MRQDLVSVVKFELRLTPLRSKPDLLARVQAEEVKQVILGLVIDVKGLLERVESEHGSHCRLRGHQSIAV